MTMSSFNIITGSSDTISPPPITENPFEMEKIGKKIFENNPRVYTDRIKEVIRRNVDKHSGNLSSKEKESVFYRSIYDYWVYGNEIGEEFFYGFLKKSHKEKLAYITSYLRAIYVKHLNEKNTFNELNNKYNIYKFLKNHYKREIIKIAGEEDYEEFCGFVKRHPEFVIKPVKLSRGSGVRKDSVKNYNSPRELFDKILSERKFLRSDTSRDSQLYMDEDVDIILEELIEIVPEMKKLNPSSVNSIRITTIKVGENIHIFYPWIKAGIKGNFVDNAHSEGVFAGINPKTGIVDTDFFDEVSHYDRPFEYHPSTNIKIRGFEVPRWSEAVSLAKELTEKFENVNYIGWDMALTHNGWIPIEANYLGDMDVPQIAYKKGLRYEFEELIGWKFDKEFWWK